MARFSSLMVRHYGWTLALAGATLTLAGCTGAGTRLQAPTASIQQLGTAPAQPWVVILRVQNQSYDTGMWVQALDASLSLDGAPAGQLSSAPALQIPAMNADTATVRLTPDGKAVAALAAAKGGTLRYELQGTLTVGKDAKGGTRPFKFKDQGYISPVPGVPDTWR